MMTFLENVPTYYSRVGGMRQGEEIHQLLMEKVSYLSYPYHIICDASIQYILQNQITYF